MPEHALIIGAAGVGKTRRLLDTMEKAMSAESLDPREIGFVSFTRAVRREAAERAADRFDLKPGELEKNGWFKTIHGIAFRQLCVGDELLAPGAATTKWIRAAIGEDVSGASDGADDEAAAELQGKYPADVALALWGIARNRLLPFALVHERAWRCDERTPDPEFCHRVVTRYEQQKRLDHRCDFTDLLGRYAGWSFQLAGPFAQSPSGEIPNVPVWFIDEAQDNSALLDAVAQRMTCNAKWVYLSGDPYQSVYGFNGADPALFQNWGELPQNKHVLAKSWRCPSCIVDLGEDIIRGCSDYWDRGVVAADHEGEIESRIYQSSWPDDVDPRESWLILARTNFQARRLQQRLNARGVPWVPTRGHGGWATPERNKATLGLLGLSRGEVVFAAEWKAITKCLPNKSHGIDLLARGTKTAWHDREVPHDSMEFKTLDNIVDWGGTATLIHEIQSGRWVELIERAADFKSAVDRWGNRAVMEPRVRVGTVHSAKGLEADNVAVLLTTSHQVGQSMQDQRGEDEERRVAYVAVTRTRKRLMLLKEKTRYEMEIPA